MKINAAFVPALLLLFGLPLAAKDAAKATQYFDPATIQLKALLPDPPADGSPETLKEMDVVLQEQAARTPEQIARIKREEHLSVWVFDDTVGPWFAAKNVPKTAALFHNVEESIHPVIVSAKNFWNRPRPFLQDPRVHPPIALPKNASYPSGHSTLGNLEALVLAQLLPDMKDAILARGKEIGEDRIIAGVHFPSDVAAGEKLAQDLYSHIASSPEFQADLAAAKTEIAAIRPK